MTIIEAISIVDKLKPNTFKQQDKVRWLADLDGIVKSEIIDTHEGGEKIEYEKYTDNTPLNTKMLIPAPYDRIYILFLEMQIDYANEEYRKYNNSAAAYNMEFSEYEKYYNREHKPLSRGKRFIF